MKVDTVSRLAFYPIKGCHEATINGSTPTSLDVGLTGFEVHGVRDRDWVLFDPKSSTFVSQRGWGGEGKKVVSPQDRALATVAIDVRPDYVTVTSKVGTLELPTAATSGEPRILDIFGKQLPVIAQGLDSTRYFTRLLGREVWLMRSDRENPRGLPERYCRQGAFNQVAGTDGMPFLLASEASLAKAHKNTETPPGSIPIDRYRANIVIDGNSLGPFGEDFIDNQEKFRIGEIGMWVVKACSRCPVPDIDQSTGERVGGGLRVLRGRVGSIFTGEEGVFFGQNLVHANIGTISVGDAVAVNSFSVEPNITFRA